MIDRLLICTDLDRTLIPNGPQSESRNARKYFTTLVNCPEVTLTYVSGRHRALIEEAISHYNLPQPDFVVGDVGTSIYHVGTENDWQRQTTWEKEIACDWGNKSHADIKKLLLGIPELSLQEQAKQNRYKLSYYIPLQSEQDTLSALIRERLSRENVRASLIWSVDEPNATGLLDILPGRATKFHAVESLMKEHTFDLGNTVFCGDSGNDIEVMASAIPAVLVANSQADVKLLARQLADSNGCAEQLYIAQGNFMGMNGNYAAGMLEGIAHYYPETVDWMGFADQRSAR